MNKVRLYDPLCWPPLHTINYLRLNLVTLVWYPIYIDQLIITATLPWIFDKKFQFSEAFSYFIKIDYLIELEKTSIQDYPWLYDIKYLNNIL